MIIAMMIMLFGERWRWSRLAKANGLFVDFIALGFLLGFASIPLPRPMPPGLVAAFVAELVGVVGLVTLTVRMVFRDEFTSWRFLLFACRLFELVAFFALTYRVMGITGPNGRAETFGACLYFSITTITTIGFGDFYPLPQARVFVAFEALIGWLYMGLFIAALTNYLGRKKS